MNKMFISVIILSFLISTLGMISDNLETVTQQMNKWHSDCNEQSSKTKGNGKGFFFRQCMKNHRNEARKIHAHNLRTSLNEEIKELKIRKETNHLKKSSKNNVWEGKPHILLITTDQQRQDTLGCYNDLNNEDKDKSNKQSSFKAKTPYIDQLAKEGMIVKDAWAASPVCSPSRTSILLGVHVPIHGVIENGLGFYSDSRLTSFIEHLSKSGYLTALIGKAGFSPIPYDMFTHLNILGEGGEDREFGTSQYDYLETYLVNCSMQWILEQDRLYHDVANKPWFLHLSLMSPHPPNTIPTEWKHRYNGQRKRKGGEEGGGLEVDIDYSSTPPSPDYVLGDFKRLPLQTKFLQGMIDIPPNQDALKALGLNNLYNDSISMKLAVKQAELSRINKLRMMNHHHQNHEEEQEEDLFEEGLPTDKWFLASRAFPKQLKGKPDLLSIASSRNSYYNQVAYLDDQIGRLMFLLDHELEYKDRLLVIFTSDHGAMLHDHGVPDKHTLLGESPRVPLILRWPLHIKPKTQMEMASLIDVTATILTAGQIKHDKWKEVSGIDLINSSSLNQRTAVAITDFFGYGIITSKWKLFHYPQHNETYLFHRQSDPNDRINRYDEMNFKASDFGPYKINHQFLHIDNKNHHQIDNVGNLKGKDNHMLVKVDSDLENLPDSVVGGVMLYSLLRWRSRQIPPKLKPEDHQQVHKRRIRPYNTESKNIVDVWGMDAENGLMDDLKYL